MVIITPINPRPIYKCCDSIELLAYTSLADRGGADQVHAGCSQVHPGVEPVSLRDWDGETLGVVWIFFAAVERF